MKSVSLRRYGVEIEKGEYKNEEENRQNKQRIYKTKEENRVKK